MKGKRIGTSVLAALMLAGTTATSALAAMPDRTAVIGEKAFELTYVNADENKLEIRDALIAAKTGGKGIYVKVRETWYNNDGSKLADTSVIPAVVYKSAEGEVSYEAGDGEEVTAGFAIKEISATGVQKIKVVFSEAAETEKASFAVKKGSYARNVEKVEWNEEKTEATISIYQKIVKGDYSVTVNGLELKESTMEFAAENERVDKIIINEEVAPVKGQTKTDDGKVQFSFKKLNQYGDATTIGTNEVISVSLEGKSAVSGKKNTYQCKAPVNFEKNMMVKEMPFVVNIYCDGVSVSKTIKAVPGAKISTLALGDVYTKFDKIKKMEAVSAVSGSKVIVKAELTDQYGNKMDASDFDTIDMATLKGASAFGSLSVTDVANFTTEFAKNTADTEDDAIYLVLTGKTYTEDETEKQHVVAATGVRIFASLSGKIADKEIAAKKATKSNTIEVSIPELYFGEKNKIAEFAVYDKNGEPFKGQDLADALNSGLTATTGEVKASYDKKTEKVSVVWNLENVDSKVDKKVNTMTFLHIKPDNLANSSYKSVPVKAMAYPANAIIENSTIKKLRPGTEMKLSLADMKINDQYGRTMKAAQLAENADITVVGAVDAAGTVVEKDGKKVNKEWTINAKGLKETVQQFGTTTAAIKLVVQESTPRTENYKFSVETVKADAIKKIEVKVPSIMYGGKDGFTAAEYKEGYSIVGRTANGTEIVLNATTDYTITASNNFDQAELDKGVIQLVKFFEIKADKTKKINFFVLPTNGIAKNVEETITFKPDAPAVDKIEMAAGESTIEADKAVYTTADIIGLIKSTDQYGKAIELNVQNILINAEKGDVTVDKNGNVNANITAMDEDAIAKVKVFTTNNKTIEFKIVNTK